MCLIMIKEPDMNPTTEFFNDVNDYNPDGWGIMYLDPKTNKPVVIKGLKYKKFKRTYSLLTRNKELSDNTDFIIHFRLRTHGAINMENLHPYEVYPDELYLMHNGIFKDFGNPDPEIGKKTATPEAIAKYKRDQRYSDTFLFIRDFLKPMLDTMTPEGRRTFLRTDGFRKLIEAYCTTNSSRLAFLDSSGPVYFGGWYQTKEMKMWVSNTYAFKVDNPTATKITRKTKSEKKAEQEAKDRWTELHRLGDLDPSSIRMQQAFEIYRTADLTTYIYTRDQDGLWTRTPIDNKAKTANQYGNTAWWPGPKVGYARFYSYITYGSNTETESIYPLWSDRPFTEEERKEARAKLGGQKKETVADTKKNQSSFRELVENLEQAGITDPDENINMFYTNYDGESPLEQEISNVEDLIIEYEQKLINNTDDFLQTLLDDFDLVASELWLWSSKEVREGKEKISSLQWYFFYDSSNPQASLLRDAQGFPVTKTKYDGCNVTDAKRAWV